MEPSATRTTVTGPVGERLQAGTEDAPVLDRQAPLRRLYDSGAGYKYPVTYLWTNHSLQFTSPDDCATARNVIVSNTRNLYRLSWALCLRRFASVAANSRLRTVALRSALEGLFTHTFSVQRNKREATFSLS